jgi:hypothetical protein
VPQIGWCSPTRSPNETARPSVTDQSAFLFPIAARAQQSRVVLPVIGKLDPAPILRPFRDQLTTLGYVDGQNVRSASPHLLHVAHPHCPRI